MSRVISVYIDDATEDRLGHLANERDSSIEELAENAVSGAALNEYRGRDYDPAKH